MPRFVALLFVAIIYAALFTWYHANSARSTAPSLEGEVRDADGPIAGALVRIKGTNDLTQTDEEGRFTLAGLRASRSGRITASKDGYIIGGVSIGPGALQLHLRKAPAQDCERYAWIDPTPDPAHPHNCGNCHRAIFEEWRHSGHARSITGQRFRDVFGELVREHPLGADVCSSCHSPTLTPAEFAAQMEPGSGSTAVGLTGTHCDFCHKVRGLGGGEIGLSHGRNQLNLLRPDPEGEQKQLFFGPLDDVDRGDDQHSRFQRDSRFCAACHEGIVFGIPVYTTFSEWQASPAGKAGIGCTVCHMRPTGKMTNIAPGHGGVRRDPSTLGNHRFFDGSHEQMLKRCLQMESSIKRTEEWLELDLALTAIQVGHRVPTGFIDRQLLLIVDAFQGQRAVTAYQGPTLPGLVGSKDGGKAGRLYARVLTDGQGLGPQPFWNASADNIVDTRLQPGQTDHVRFRFPAGTDFIRARVVLRRFWHRDAAAKRWPDTEELVIDRQIVPISPGGQ